MWLVALQSWRRPVVSPVLAAPSLFLADLFYDKGRRCISPCFCSQQWCMLNDCLPLLSKPTSWIDLIVSYHSSWAGRGLLPGLCGQRPAAMEQGSVYYLASAITNRIAFLVSIQINPGRALLCGQPCHRKSGIMLTKKGAIRYWVGRGLRAHSPCDIEAYSWLWQRESRFVLKNTSGGGTQSMFCRCGCKVECKKQYYLLGYVSEAVTVMEIWQRGLPCDIPYVLIVFHAEKSSVSWEGFILSYKAVWMVL